MTEKQYRLKTKKADGTPTTNEKIGQNLKNTNDKIADTLVGANKKIENGVVETYDKIKNAFVDRFLEEVPEKNDDKSSKK